MLRSSRAWKQIGLLGFVGAAALSAASAFQHQNPGQEQQTAGALQTLRRGEAVEFNAAPPNVVDSGCKCGADGDIYLVYSDAPPILAQGCLSGIPVSKISLRSRQVVSYRVPNRIKDFEGQVFRLSFDVSSDGTLYALFNTGRRGSDGEMKPEFLIGKYDDDGGIDSFTNIGQIRGKTVQPSDMAVLFNGRAFLLSGTTVEEQGLGSFTGLFNGSGEFVKLVALGDSGMMSGENQGGNAAGQSGPPSEAKQLEAGAENPAALGSSVLSFSGKDGNVYLLQGTSAATLSVISPLGEVVRRHQLKPPDPDLSPLQMAQAGEGHLFIRYGYVSKGEPGEGATSRSNMITVLNSATGEVEATYRIPQEKGYGLPACAESPRKFTFIGASEDNRRLVVIPYSAP